LLVIQVRWLIEFSNSNLGGGILKSKISENQYSKYFSSFGLVSHAVLNLITLTGIFTSLSGYSNFDFTIHLSIFSVIMISSPIISLLGAALILNETKSGYFIGWFGMMIGMPPLFSYIFLIWAVYCGILFSFWIGPVLLNEFDDFEYDDDDDDFYDMQPTKDSVNFILEKSNNESSEPSQSMTGNMDEKGTEWLEFPPKNGVWFWRNTEKDDWAKYDGS